MANTEKYTKTLRDFVKILQNIREIRSNRDDCVERLFWEFKNCNVDLFEDFDSKIKKYLPEKISYPKAFLASNISFNRSSMDPKYSDVLNKFRLDRRSNSGSLRNALHFDIFKNLIIKYFEKLKNK